MKGKPGRGRLPEFAKIDAKIGTFLLFGRVGTLTQKKWLHIKIRENRQNSLQGISL